MKVALKHADKLPKKQVLAAEAYYTPEEIVSIFSEASGKKAVFIQVTPEQYKASLPPAVANEFLENHLFVEEPGYYLGQSLEATLSLLDSKPTTWKEFVQKNKKDVSAWK